MTAALADDVTCRRIHYELLMMAITSIQNVIIVATAYTVRYTVTTAFAPACYDAEAEATLRSNKAHFPPYLSLSLSSSLSLALSQRPFTSPSMLLWTDSFSSLTRHSPRASSAPIATTTTTTGPPRVTAFPSLSPSTNSIVQPRFNIYAGPHAERPFVKCRSGAVIF